MSKYRSISVPKEPQQARIEKLSHDGRGIAYINGKTTFIDAALPGESVDFIYHKKHKQFDEGTAVHIHHPAPQRVQPACRHFKVCGGCSLQHMSHDAQIELKQQTLLDQLKHFGAVEPETVLDPLRGPIWHYRRKARLSAKYVRNKGGVLVGFREKQSSLVADIDDCSVLHTQAANLIKPLKQFVTELEAHACIPQIEIAVDDQHCALVFRHLQPLSDADKIRLESFAAQWGIYLYTQAAGPDSVSLLYPKQEHAYLNYYFAEYDLTLHFLPTDFSQVNLAINKLMLKRVIELLRPQANDQILDLFCGFGNFTLPLARYCQNVTGVEGSQSAVARARFNAQQNQIAHADFHAFDLTTDFFHEIWAKKPYNKLLLDPPRSGAEAVVKHMEKLAIPLIIYISCNPATLARDAGILVKQGYHLRMAGIMDMFPHTSHVESIAVFEKKSHGQTTRNLSS